MSLGECGRSNERLSCRIIPVYTRQPIKTVCPAAKVNPGSLRNQLYRLKECERGFSAHSFISYPVTQQQCVLCCVGHDSCYSFSDAKLPKCFVPPKPTNNNISDK